MHASCIICADLFNYTQDISVCPCGHAFHFTCLQRWMTQSKTCPQCRHKVLAKNIIQKLYFDVSHKDGDVSPDIQNELEDIKVQLINAKKQTKTFIKEKEEFETKISSLQNQMTTLRKSLRESEMTCSVLKTQLEHQDREIAEAVVAKSECEEIKNKLLKLQNLEKILKGSSKEADDILKTYGKDYSDPVLHSIAGICSALKRELQNSNERAACLKKQVRELKEKLITANGELKEKDKVMSEMQLDLNEAEKIKSGFNSKLETIYSEISTCDLNSPSSSHLKRKDLIRLLVESPMPEMLKKSIEDERSGISKPLEETHNYSPLIMTPKSLKNNIHAQKGPPLKIRTLTSNPPKVVRFPIGRFNKTPSLGSIKQNFGYNGLGGHSKHEEFPNPKIKRLKHINSKTSLTKSATRTENNTLFNYVSNENGK